MRALLWLVLILLGRWLSSGNSRRKGFGPVFFCGCLPTSLHLSLSFCAVAVVGLASLLHFCGSHKNGVIIFVRTTDSDTIHKCNSPVGEDWFSHIHREVRPEPQSSGKKLITPKPLRPLSSPVPRYSSAVSPHFPPPLPSSLDNQ